MSDQETTITVEQALALLPKSLIAVKLGDGRRATTAEFTSLGVELAIRSASGLTLKGAVIHGRHADMCQAFTIQVDAASAAAVHGRLDQHATLFMQALLEIARNELEVPDPHDDGRSTIMVERSSGELAEIAQRTLAIAGVTL